MPRTIIHLDLDAFYCSIEEQRDPSLRGVPFAVGAAPDQRGVVASCSYAARARGVRSAMPMSHALRLCPQLRVVPVRHAVYRATSRQVMARLRALTPLVEQLSIDEAFLDVSALVPTGQSAQQQERAARALARRLQLQIAHELGLSCSVGVASNKMVAKIATDCGKASSRGGRSPQAMCVVPHGTEAEFLAPLPVGALWGVGPKTEARLESMGAHSIGDIARRDPRELVRAFGSHGYEMWQHARGIDKREIVTSRPSKSISSETTFSEDIADWNSLSQVLGEQVEAVARQLRGQKLRASTVKLKLRWPDFSTPTRQATLAQPTDSRTEIHECAAQLLRSLWPPGQPVRLLGVGVSGLGAVRQLGLWDESIPDTDPAAQELQPRAEVAPEAREFQDKQQRVWEAVALLQGRYGARAVQLGAEEPGTPA
jgi:DNA polymerase-4